VPAIEDLQFVAESPGQLLEQLRQLVYSRIFLAQYQGEVPAMSVSDQVVDGERAVRVQIDAGATGDYWRWEGVLSGLPAAGLMPAALVTSSPGWYATTMSDPALGLDAEQRTSVEAMIEAFEPEVKRLILEEWCDADVDETIKYQSVELGYYERRSTLWIMAWRKGLSMGVDTVRVCTSVARSEEVPPAGPVKWWRITGNQAASVPMAAGGETAKAVRELADMDVDIGINNNDIIFSVRGRAITTP